MKLVLCRSNSLISWIIRKLTWSSWSHVVLVNGDEAIEAVWPRVRKTTVEEALSGQTEAIELDIPCENELLAWDAALRQVGKRYDLAALFGFLFRRDWASPSKWFCSELAAYAFEKGQSPLFRSENTDRITPQMIYLLPHDFTILK